MINLRDGVAAMQPLRQAAFEGDLSKLKVLCKEQGVNVDEAGPESGRTALHWGALTDNNEVVSYLLNAKKAAVDPLDVHWDTPLNLVIQGPNHFHFSQKKLAVIDSLVAHGADATLANRQGKTPLMNLIHLIKWIHLKHPCQLKNINAIFAKIKESIYQKALRAGQTAHIHPEGKVVMVSKGYGVPVSKSIYIPRSVPVVNSALRRPFQGGA